MTVHVCLWTMRHSPRVAAAAAGTAGGPPPPPPPPPPLEPTATDMRGIRLTAFFAAGAGLLSPAAAAASSAARIATSAVI